MNRKQIDVHLKSVLDRFVNAIDDADVKLGLSEKIIVTGGCFVQLLKDEEPNDYDFYFRCPKKAIEVANYFLGADGHAERDADSGEIRITYDSTINEINTEKDTERVDDPNYRVLHISPNAITLTNGIQLVFRFYGDVEEIHENFDFVHCTCSWTPGYGSGEHALPGTVNIPVAAMESILTNELRYVGSLYPVCSLLRLRKFLHRGWKVNGGQILKIALQISQLDLHKVKTLQSQLIGVDTAYFRQLYEAIESNATDEMLDGKYLVRLIDSIF